MTIDKAIEILTLAKTCDFEGDARDLEDAIKLGTEALKREIHNRRIFPDVEVSLLPGEISE